MSTSRTFQAAGVLFTDGTDVLAGFQPLKEEPSISGFGGSREGKETIRETAFRELLEELFEPEPTFDIKPLIRVLKERYKKDPIIKKSSYRFLILPFRELAAILALVKAIGMRSQVYTTIPTTIADLIKKRVPLPTSEISTLMLLSRSTTTGPKGESIDPYFLEDLQSI
jgi:hypothetical protein